MQGLTIMETTRFDPQGRRQAGKLLLPRSWERLTTVQQYNAVRQPRECVKALQIEGREQLEHGMKVMYRTPEMPRRRKGTVTGSDESGWEVTGQRQGHCFKPSQHILPREQIWTVAEHEADRAPKGTHIAVSGHGRILRPEIVRERAQKGYQRLGMTEAEVLTHPELVRTMRNQLERLARSNHIVIEPGFCIRNGMVYNDTPESMDAYSEFEMAVLNSLRRQTAQAPDEMVDEFRDHLQGIRDNSRIYWTAMKDGKTAALRHILEREHELQTHDEFNTAAEGGFDAGMRDISAQTATTVDEGIGNWIQAKADIARALWQLRAKNRTAVKILMLKFALGRATAGMADRDIARRLERETGEVWNGGKVALVLAEGLNLMRSYLRVE